MTLLLISPSPFFMEQVEEETAIRMPSLNVIGKCYSLQEGIRAAATLQPDIVLLDVEIERTGLEVLTMLRKNCRYLVILTNAGIEFNWPHYEQVDYIGDFRATIGYLQNLLV